MSNVMHINNVASGSPSSMMRALLRHRHLLWQMTKRDVAMRYRGSALGVLWSLITPLLMLGVYTFVFGVVFKARFGEQSGADDTMAFALILFCGLMVHAVVAECITRSPAIILQHSNYVKKVVFPLEILPVMVLGSALFNVLMSFIVLVVAWFIIYGSLPVTLLLFPLVIVPLLPMLLGVSWVLASLGVYLRDIQHISGLFSTILLFLSPIFYPAEALPLPYRDYLYVNPLTLIIESARQTLTQLGSIDWHALAIYFCVGVVISCVGFWWFQRTRKGFADII